MHMMIDTETWGLATNSAIRSIGVAIFSPTMLNNQMTDTYYSAVKDNTGIRQDSTVEWWSKQSAEAQSVFDNPELLEIVLKRLTELFHDYHCDCVWAHGPVFDIPLLENAYARSWMKAPWKYWNIRDTRTIYDLAQEKPTSLPGYMTKHHALHDAVNQAAAVQRSYQILFAKR